VLKLISWKHSFDRLNEEYDMTKKKKQALDNLLNDGRISQSTYDSFNDKMDEAIAEIEKQQKVLLEKMNFKIGEFEQHIKTLEMLLANFEIKHVTGEIDEEVYQREVSLLSTGLDVSKQELNTARDAIDQLSTSMPVSTIDLSAPQEIETETMENVEPEETEIASEDETVLTVESEETPQEDVEEKLPEPPVESVDDNLDTVQNPEEPQETSQETWQNTEETQETMQSSEEEETQSTEVVAEGEETQD